VNKEVLLASAMVALLGTSFVAPPQTASAHFDHLAHYNGIGMPLGPYYVYEVLDPEFAPPGQPVAIMFSIQDTQGHDVYNVTTMVEIYSGQTGERIKAFPWTKESVGDFQLFYTFDNVGSYQIVLSVANGPVNTNGIDPPRSMLSSSLNCNCDRAVYNVSISNTGFGGVFDTTVLAAVFAPSTLIGGILLWSFKNRRKKGYFKTEPGDIVRYIVIFAAMAGGLVHFAVYSSHASLRIEYSIFLIIAGGMQVSYSVIYAMITLNNRATGRMFPRQHYRKTLATNLFGLIGTLILLGLYTYSVIFPPPLSPNNLPEHVDAEGIFAKSVEVFDVIGILYLMKLEKRLLGKILQEPA
jgi:hypothetical protein